MKTIRTILIAMLVIMASVQANAAPISKLETQVPKSEKSIKYTLIIKRWEPGHRCQTVYIITFDLRYGLPIDISYTWTLDCHQDEIPALIHPEDEQVLTLPDNLYNLSDEEIVTWGLQQLYPNYTPY